MSRSFPSERFEEGGSATDWFHAKCLFDALKRARKARKIEKVGAASQLNL